MNPLGLFLSLGLVPQALLLTVSLLQLQAYLSRRRHHLVFVSTLAPLVGLLVTSAETASALSTGGPALQAVSGSLAGTFSGILLLCLGKIGERRLLRPVPVDKCLGMAKERCRARDLSLLNHAIASAIEIEKGIDGESDPLRKAQMLMTVQSIQAMLDEICDASDLPTIAWSKPEPAVRIVDAVVVPR